MSFLLSRTCIRPIVEVLPGICAGLALAVIGQRGVYAQSSSDSLTLLEPLEITSTRLQSFTVGDKLTPVLARALGTEDHNNLSRLLMNYSGVNVRSYGISGVSTASLRGSGSNHTPVFWEGMNLQSSMNGSLDLTLIPVSFVDEVALQYGSAGSLYGTGTMGGAIHLSSDASIATGARGEAYQQLGSFGSYYTGIRTEYRAKQVAFRLRAFRSQADNDFPYFNNYRNRPERRQHAGISQRGSLAELYWDPAERHRFTIKYWLQDSHVEIPEVAAAGGEAQAIQDDRFHRAVLHWNVKQPNAQFQVRTALLRQRLHYDDGLREASLSQATSWIAELEHTLYLKEEQWFFWGLNHTYEQTEVDRYGSRSPQRHRTALFLSYRREWFKQLVTSLGLRQTLVNRGWAPLLPTIALAYSLHERWRIRTKIARSYNLPTFNDLYWVGVSEGNPQLRPETGWSTELGLKGSIVHTDRCQLDGTITIFSNLMADWIQWVPREQWGWSPINVHQVWARGVEADIRSDHTLTKQLSVQFWGHYSYTRSTKEKIAPGGSLTELHKQLIYTPYHQAKTSANVRYKAWKAGIAGRYIGSQYTTASNRQELPAYTTVDLSLGYRWALSENHQLLLNAGLYNLFDHRYEVRQGYPMPGRNYQMSIVYQLK